MTDSKLESGEPVISKAALIYGQMNEPPRSSARRLSALTAAEYFPMSKGRTCFCSSTTSSDSPSRV